MGTAFCVHLQLYVFISKPQLSLNWDEKKKKIDSRTEKWVRGLTHTHRTTGLGFVTLTSKDTVASYALEHFTHWENKECV